MYTHTMEQINKRRLFFLLGCVPTRLFIVYLAKTSTTRPFFLNCMAVLSSIPMIGFLYLYMTKSRMTGMETYGQPIWWHELRIVHFLFYLAFITMVFATPRLAYIPLLFDVIMGTMAFFIHHANINLPPTS
jgi:hypothetical protein